MCSCEGRIHAAQLTYNSANATEVSQLVQPKHRCG